MKNIKITFKVCSCEIVTTKLMVEEYHKLQNYYINNKVNNLSDEVDEGLGRECEWYDCDDLGHYYGTMLDQSSAISVVIDKNKETIYPVRKFKNNNVCDIQNSNETLTLSFISISDFKNQTIEFKLNDDISFDIDKINFDVSKVITTNDVHELITSFYYGGKELEVPNNSLNYTLDKCVSHEINVPISIVEKEKWLEGDGPQTD